MNHPLKILNDSLKEAEKVQSDCLLNYNKEDFLLIQKEVITPIKIAIRLIELAVENELKFNVLVEQ